jgi:putative ABC transport system ATP-binding protein
MIEVNNLSHYYGKEKILDNINLELMEGSFTILTGESGSGKTTLLSIMSTLLQQSHGEVVFHNIPKCSIDTMRNKHIGFIFQFHYLIAHLTVIQNIKMVTKKSKKDILVILKRLGIDELANKYPSNLSGGQRQRAAVARAIINDPKYIFADEPTGNLDSENSKMIFDILREIEATILVVTHDQTHIQEKDNLLIMKDGVLEKGASC